MSLLAATPKVIAKSVAKMAALDGYRSNSGQYLRLSTVRSTSRADSPTEICGAGVNIC